MTSICFNDFPPFSQRLYSPFEKGGAVFKTDHTALAVGDLCASSAFYQYLGGVVVSKPSPHFVEILLGDLRLHLVRATGEPAPSAARTGIDHFCLAVADIATLEEVCIRINNYPALAGRGPFAIEDSSPLGADLVEHSEQRPPLKTLYMQDPDGINIEIRTYTP